MKTGIDRRLIILTICLLIVLGGVGIFYALTSNQPSLSDADADRFTEFLEQLADEQGINLDQATTPSKPKGLLVKNISIAENQIAILFEEIECELHQVTLFTQFNAVSHTRFLRELVGKRIEIFPDSTGNPNAGQIQISQISQLRVVGTQIHDAIEAHNTDHPVMYEYLIQCPQCFRGNVYDIEIPVYSAYVDSIGTLALNVQTRCGLVTVEVESNRSDSFDVERFQDLANTYLILRAALIDSESRLLVFEASDIEFGLPFDVDETLPPQ